MTIEKTEGCTLFGGYLLCSECRYIDDCDVKRWEDDES